ncbi:MAG: dihydroorotate oxidase [Nanoarchaeota archaeon]|nr:dihydroorotate oxidase [Nanoarchaeota archaeon]
MTIKIKLCGLNLSSGIMNASGPLCTSLNELKRLGKSSSGAIVLKSATIKPRLGNPEPKIFEFEKSLIQSMGLPNPGYKKFLTYIKELKQYNKPIIASVAGFSIDEYLEMCIAYENAGVDMIELNLSCPNVNKKLLCYDPETTELLIEKLKEKINIPISVKLGPYVDMYLMKEMSKALKKADCLVLINSIPGATRIDIESGKPKIGANYGGLSGESIKAIALGNVKNFYELTKKDIIGAGGIFTGNDVLEFMKAGAKAVQVGTAYLWEGPKIFDRLNKELW